MASATAAILSSPDVLRRDDTLLRQLFLRVLKHHHSDLSVKIDVLFALADQWCKSGSKQDFDELEAYLESLKPDESILTASAFSHMLYLHNLSENVVTSEQAQKGHHMRESVRKLMDSGKSASDIYQALCQQHVDLVLTAHPTQAMRESIRSKFANVRRDLRLLHGGGLKEVDMEATVNSMYASIQAAWRTDEIRRTKPTPQDEMRSGLAYFHSLFDIVPRYMRTIDDMLLKLGQPRIPLDHALITFGSWMGGDRDGNPNVKPSTTRDVAITSRLMACNLYSNLVGSLMSELSMWRCSPELRAQCEAIWAAEKQLDHDAITEERKKRNYAGYWAPLPPTEPFRCVLAQVRDKLYVTRELLHDCLAHPEENVVDALRRGGGYTDAGELMDTLKLLHRSLLETGDDGVAHSVVLNAIRQVTAFGSSLMRLDIRQESTRHRDVMNAITEYLDLGSFRDWDEDRRCEFLIAELQSKRPLVPPGIPLTPDQLDVVDTFRVLATLPPDGLGAYIISMAQTASDVLIVELLQRELGMKSSMRVVPLFETLDDLNNAPATMTRLYTTPWYLARIDGKQECMIGYSDSGKDAGRVAAAWALYQAQETLSLISRDAGIKLTLFHGRGGTVGRGGGPAHLAVLSQPPRTVDGSMRVTVQGETIEQQFGEPEGALDTLDLYASSVLRATLEDGYTPASEFRGLMQELADVSCKRYRDVVHRSEDFFRYFTTGTPVAELGSMNIGSRPSKRKALGGIESLRAIPWIFAWTQTRFHLPVWLGAGEAIMHVRNAGQGELLDQMYQTWPFFRVTMDMMAMVLAKADDITMTLYEAKLVDPSLHHVGGALRESFRNTRKAVLSIVGLESVLGSGAASEATSMLASKLQLRAPYVTPLNMLQALSMAAIRELQAAAEDEAAGNTGSLLPPGSPEWASTLQGPRRAAMNWNVYDNPETWDLLNREPEQVPDKDLLLQAYKDCAALAVNGIAAGMGNTG